MDGLMKNYLSGLPNSAPGAEYRPQNMQRPVWQGFPTNPLNDRARQALQGLFNWKGRQQPTAPTIPAAPVATPAPVAPAPVAPAAPVPQVPAPPQPVAPVAVQPTYQTNPLSTRPRGLLGI